MKILTKSHGTFVCKGAAQNDVDYADDYAFTNEAGACVTYTPSQASVMFTADIDNNKIKMMDKDVDHAHSITDDEVVKRVTKYIDLYLNDFLTQ